MSNFNETCFICNSLNTESESVILTPKGLATVLKSSQIRKDGTAEKIRNVNNLKVHIACRKQYTRRRNLVRILTTEPAGTSKSSPGPSAPNQEKIHRFSATKLQKKCLFCFKQIPDDYKEKQKKYPRYRRCPISEATTVELKETIQNKALQRNDEWGNAVSKEIANTIDLVAAKILYHQRCFSRFSKTKILAPPTRLVTIKGAVARAMNEIYSFMENSDECQFTVDEVMAKVKGHVPNRKTVETHLLKKYGSDIILAKTHKHKTVICFRNSGFTILTENWYTNKKETLAEERCRIVQAAADIIREDIRSQYHDTSVYPSAENFLEDAVDVIPNTLNILLKGIIAKRRRCEQEVLDRKITTIAHSIMLATRPNSFNSSILLALAIFLHRKFESRNLLNVLSNLGLCASYHDATMYEHSVISSPTPEVHPNAFCQFIFDNSDFNTKTLDGLHTMHVMGGVQSLTPSTAQQPQVPVQKKQNRSTKSELAVLAKIPYHFCSTARGGLDSISIDNLDIFLPCERTMEMFSPVEALYFGAKYSKISAVRGWSGFMSHLTKNLPYQKSAVLYLPFVDLPPGNYDTISTVLHFAVERSKLLNQKTVFVNFDQPLFIKAQDIVHRTPALSNVVVRLGGFHLTMSFLGCIGHFMAGSGLKECLSEVYATNSVDIMLSGHSYARAMRSHFLVQEALITILLDEIPEHMTSEPMGVIHELVHDFGSRSIELDSVRRDQNIQRLSDLLNSEAEKLADRGPTAKLWLQYIALVTLLRHYIEAERTGNWQQHLKCVRNMLPYFHAAGHFLYAKSAHLYLQQAVQLSDRMDPEEFRSFTQDGMFVIRRTSKFWSGTSPDYVIETTLNKSMKTLGGLTHGRGISDNVKNRWLLAMPAASKICDSIENFSGTSLESSYQHADWGIQRSKKDEADVFKITEWLRSHNVFGLTAEVTSLYSGVIGDTRVNSYSAFEVGAAMMLKSVGQNFQDVKYKRTEIVRPLASMSSTIRVRGEETVLVNPLLLFQRISILKKSDEELRSFFEYELSPFPLALFDERGMRKTAKSSLYSLFPVDIETKLDKNNFYYVIDGGFLLHRVVWQRNVTFGSICQAYLAYVKSHYGERATIVFDGYGTINTKNCERTRRSLKISIAVDVNFTESTIATMKQEVFLSRDKNKIRLIEMLADVFRSNSYNVKQAVGDADNLIVHSAIARDSETVVVIGEDVDLLTLLITLTPKGQAVYFLKPGKLKQTDKLYSINELKNDSRLEDGILLSHAMSGCDTTSSIFRKGKIKCYNILNRDNLQGITNIFKNPMATHEEVSGAGWRYLLEIYGARNQEISLNSYRFECFMKGAAKTIDLASLPPTEDAATLHVYRVYLQLQTWLGYQHNPTEWGWRSEHSNLVPVTMNAAPAPQNLLNLISCSCTKGCKNACSCRKAGLKCSNICSGCMGAGCLNAGEADLDEDGEDSLLDDE